ncbi:hypothetical protein GBAR_LOCUS114 [Geodia barretti]|uniref:Uncharacterized protein n=1 Tax=Geodia barretti TaxID=519541 RepID=A0AA35VZU0_GEOBA|nr:hypothetical protein GBAR_LOCUS114 [Geodia barretti]
MSGRGRGSAGARGRRSRGFVFARSPGCGRRPAARRDTRPVRRGAGGGSGGPCEEPAGRGARPPRSRCGLKACAAGTRRRRSSRTSWTGSASTSRISSWRPGTTGAEPGRAGGGREPEDAGYPLASADALGARALSRQGRRQAHHQRPGGDPRPKARLPGPAAAAALPGAGRRLLRMAPGGPFPNANALHAQERTTLRLRRPLGPLAPARRLAALFVHHRHHEPQQRPRTGAQPDAGHAAPRRRGQVARSRHHGPRCTVAVAEALSRRVDGGVLRLAGRELSND